jgi:hypothetical protein
MIVQKALTLLIISALFSMCSTEPGKQVDTTTSAQEEKLATDKKLVEKIFYNVPSPLEMAQIVREAGMSFTPSLMNPTSRKQYYIDQTTQALNLGVYGADLSYARIFDQVQESVNYLSSIRELTESLQIPQNQDIFALEKLEKNIANRDSLLYIITDIYSNVDAYLKDNNRGLIAVMIISGGWVEGNYLATASINKSNPNEAIVKRIGEQKLSLNSLIKLVEPHAKEDHKSGEVLNSLKELAKLYEDVTITASENEVDTNTETNKTTFKGESTVEIDEETLRNVSDYLLELRNKITKP